MKLRDYLTENALFKKGQRGDEKDCLWRLYFKVDTTIVKGVPWRTLLTDFGRFLVKGTSYEGKEWEIMPMPCGEWFRAHPFIPWVNWVEFTYVTGDLVERAVEILESGEWSHPGFTYMGCCLDWRDPLRQDERG